MRCLLAWCLLFSFDSSVSQCALDGAVYRGPDGSTGEMQGEMSWTAPQDVQVLQKISIAEFGTACQLVAIVKDMGQGNTTDKFALGLYNSVGTGAVARPGALIAHGEVFSVVTEFEQTGTRTIRAAIQQDAPLGPGEYWVALASASPISLTLASQSDSKKSDWMTYRRASAINLANPFAVHASERLSYLQRAAQAPMFVIMQPTSASSSTWQRNPTADCGAPQPSLYNPADLLRPSWFAKCALNGIAAGRVFQRVVVRDGGELCGVQFRALFGSGATAYVGVALYTENNDGQPGDLLVQTVATFENVFADEQWREIKSPSGDKVVLAPGAYWVAFRMSSAQAITVPSQPTEHPLLDSPLLSVPSETFAVEFQPANPLNGVEANPVACPSGGSAMWPVSLTVNPAGYEFPIDQLGQQSPVQIAFIDSVFDNSLHGSASFASTVRELVAEAFVVPTRAIEMASVSSGASGSVLVSAKVRGQPSSVSSNMVARVIQGRLTQTYRVGTNVQVTYSQPPTSPPAGAQEKPIGPGAIAGISLGVLVAVAGIAFGVVWARREPRGKSASAFTPSSPAQSSPVSSSGSFPENSQALNGV